MDKPKNTSNRLNLKLNPDLFDYAREMAGIKHMSVTDFINGLIAAHKEQNIGVYKEHLKLSKQVKD